MKAPNITKEEVEIIKSAQAGNILAFNKLFNRYKTFVDNVLFTYLKDMDEAKDLTNIVFLKVYEKLSTFTEYSSFGGFLRIIANRTAIDYLRSKKLKTIEDENDRLSLNSSISSNEDELVNRLSYDEIVDSFKIFPEHMQRILELFYVENMTVDQIGQSLSISTGTIKSILSRTRKKLQKQFNHL